MLSKFSARLCELRKEKGISQKQAASELGITQALLSHYERGIRECKFDFLIVLSEYYGVSCDYLLGYSNRRDSSYLDASSEIEWPDDDKLNMSTLIHVMLILREHMNKNDNVYGDRFLWCCSLFLYRCAILEAQEGDLPESWLGDSNIYTNKFYIKHIESILESYLQSDASHKSQDDMKAETPLCIKTLYETVEEQINKLMRQT